MRLLQGSPGMDYISTFLAQGPPRGKAAEPGYSAEDKRLKTCVA